MSARVAAIVPAKDEAERVAATVTALLSLQDVDVVVVVDDGSTDATASEAADAGALVARHPANRGKAAALETGVARLVTEEQRTGSPEHVLLFADADLAESAANLEPLVVPVLLGSADLTVANIPRSASSLGSGRVVRLARAQIEAMTGRTIEQPLNGMRALNRATFADATPLAPGWGVEAAMLVDVLRAGRRVVEVPVELTHRRTGNDIKGRVHRAMQLRDVSTALLARRFLS
ncbi:glycosyl transferase family 2 [Janibacter indicus]|uniref:Glucosyl-3-phosphoglycerate synthase n=1 Tax=Janibacter indicus TaxID=857417 RepID=A0A1L3MCV8_9MICO|nr:glycosyltransferase [Janibacter indicus]APH00178.1 glycosyl transferase family 2 [Janibacter indicus]